MTEGTEFSHVRFKGDAERVAATYEGTQALKAEDVAQAVLWIVSRPAHVNVTSLQLMPVCQAPAQVAIHRAHPSVEQSRARGSAVHAF